MLDLLQGFVHELRAAGLPVSMTENLDAMRAVEHVDIAERGFEGRAVVERHVLDRAHGIEVLGHRHRKAGEPELVHEALEHVEHGRVGGGSHAFTARGP